MSTEAVESVSTKETAKSSQNDSVQESGSSGSQSSSGNGSGSDLVATQDFENEVLRAEERERNRTSSSGSGNGETASSSSSSESSSGSDVDPVDEASGSGSSTGTSGPGATGMEDAANTLLNVEDEIGKLNSDGDRIVMNMTLEAKGQVPLVRIPVGVGGKGQYGYDISVTQRGDGEAEPATYDVTFGKDLQAGLTAELQVPGVDPAAELNVGSSDTVTMNFASQEDAARAVEILQRLGTAETVRDGINTLVSPALGAAGAGSNPVPEDSASGLDTHSWPTPGNIATEELRPSDEDMQFLRDNITSYSQELNVQERGKLGVKAANLGLETRLDGNQRVIRTVDVPRNGEPGQLSYTISGEVDSSTKERLTIGQQQFDQFEVGYIPQNIVDHGTMTQEVTLSWDLPADESYSTIAGRPVPELAGLGAPDELSARMQMTYQDQSLLDLSRTDQRNVTLDVSVRNPTEHAGPVINSLLQGDVRAAMAGMDDDFTVTATDQNIARYGSHQQHEIGLTVADVGKFGLSLIADVGRDDIVSERSRTFTGSQMAEGANETPPADPVPEVDENTPPEAPAPDIYAVTPHDGLNVREEAGVNSDRASVLRHGTFVEGTGDTRIDADGNQWVQVRGRGIDGEQTTGWVNGRYLEPSSVGGMDENGRINTGLEEQGYESVEVREGDNLWNIAVDRGIDPQELIALNKEHLIDPNLIYAGDQVYLPGTQAPAPEPEETPVEETPDVCPVPEEGAPSESSSGSSEESERSSSGEETAPSGTPSTQEPSESGNSGEEPSSSGNRPVPPATPDEESPSSSGSDEPGSSDSAPVEEGRSTDDSEADDPVGTPPNGDEAARQAELQRILNEYQIAEDPNGTVEWSPGGLAGLFVDDTRRVTSTEAEMLDSLSVFGLKDMNDIKSKAEEVSEQYYPAPDYTGQLPNGEVVDQNAFNMWAANDGHQDAFRHAYWNALMTKRFGEGFADGFASAHEGVSNPADREAMDLYNNEAGRQIALDNPGASDEELAQLVYDAIENGDMIVIDGDNELSWSNDVEYGGHGQSVAEELPANIDTPDAVESAS